MEKWEPSYTAGGNVNGIATMDNSMEIPFKTALPYDPTIPIQEKNHNSLFLVFINQN